MKLSGNDEGVSEIFGYVIILGIVVSGLALVLLLVVSSIQSTKDNSQLKEVEQGFTVMDSRLSKARFSTSIFQEAAFKLNDGTVIVDDSYSNSYIMVYEDNQQLYPLPVGSNVALGTIKCVTDSGEIAYQGGGVWALYDKDTLNERCEMISPPDFDYNGVTLTLPIMRIIRNNNPNSILGSEAVSGRDNIIFIDSSSSGKIDLKFPVPGGVNPADTNPILKDKVIKIVVKSDYYRGWESYFRERVNDLDSVTPDEVAHTVTVTLSSGSGRQSKTLQNDFDTKNMKVDDPAPIEIFYFTFYPKGIGNAYGVFFDTNSPTTVNPRLKIDIERTTAHLNKEYAEVVFTYTYNSPVHGSYTEVFRGRISFHRKSDTEFTLDLLDTNTVPEIDTSTTPPTIYDVMVYESPSSSISWGNNYTAPEAGSEVNPGDTKSMFDVTEHYTWIMAKEFPTTPGDPNSGPKYNNIKNKYLEPTSNFILQFGSDEQIKYLYITEATLDSAVSSKGA